MSTCITDRLFHHLLIASIAVAVAGLPIVSNSLTSRQQAPPLCERDGIDKSEPVDDLDRVDWCPAIVPLQRFVPLVCVDRADDETIPHGPSVCRVGHFERGPPA